MLAAVTDSPKSSMVNAESGSSRVFDRTSMRWLRAQALLPLGASEPPTASPSSRRREMVPW